MTARQSHVLATQPDRRGRSLGVRRLPRLAGEPRPRSRPLAARPDRAGASSTARGSPRGSRPAARSNPGAQKTSVRLGRPSVSVPVLSNTTVRHEPMFSRTAASLIKMPRRAASEIAPMIATGIASSSGHGVAITRTARNRFGSPLAIQPAAATLTASSVYHAPSRSARRRMGGRRSSASRTMPTMRAYRRVHGEPRGRDRQQSGLIDRTRDDRCADGLANDKGLAAQVRLVHRRRAVHDDAVHRTHFVWQHHEHVAHSDIIERHIFPTVLPAAMGVTGMPSSERIERG